MCLASHFATHLLTFVLWCLLSSVCVCAPEQEPYSFFFLLLFFVVDWSISVKSNFISFSYRSIHASQAEDSGDRHVLPNRNIQPDGLWHTRLLARERYCVAPKYKMLPWWQQEVSMVKTDTELSAWLVGAMGGLKLSKRLHRLREWEQSDNSTWCLTTRALPSIAAFDLSQLNNVFCFPMQGTEVLTPNWETWLILREKHFTLQTTLIWMELYWCLLH